MGKLQGKKGRPFLGKEKMIQVGFFLEEDIAQEIERIALKRKMGKGQIYRMMIDLGVECHKDMEKLGIITAVDFAYYVKKTLKDRLSKEKNIQMSLI